MLVDVTLSSYATAFSSAFKGHRKLVGALVSLLTVSVKGLVSGL